MGQLQQGGLLAQRIELPLLRLRQLHQLLAHLVEGPHQGTQLIRTGWLAAIQAQRCRRLRMSVGLRVGGDLRQVAADHALPQPENEQRDEQRLGRIAQQRNDHAIEYALPCPLVGRRHHQLPDGLHPALVRIRQLEDAQHPRPLQIRSAPLLHLAVHADLGQHEIGQARDAHQQRVQTFTVHDPQVLDHAVDVGIPDLRHARVDLVHVVEVGVGQLHARDEQRNAGAEEDDVHRQAPRQGTWP